MLFVADVKRALRFYVDLLGFEKAWHEDDGNGKVCQVNSTVAGRLMMTSVLGSP